MPNLIEFRFYFLPNNIWFFYFLHDSQFFSFFFFPSSPFHLCVSLSSPPYQRRYSAIPVKYNQAPLEDEVAEPATPRPDPSLEPGLSRRSEASGGPKRPGPRLRLPLTTAMMRIRGTELLVRPSGPSRKGRNVDPVWRGPGGMIGFNLLKETSYSRPCIRFNGQLIH